LLLFKKRDTLTIYLLSISFLCFLFIFKKI